MKKTKLLVALMAVICVFAFAACGASYDPVAYVEGTMDAAFHGNITDEYISMLADADSAQELEEDYNYYIEELSDRLIMSMGIAKPGETLRQDTYNMMINVLDAAKYEVSPDYTEGENGEYYVEVIVYPLLTFMEVCNDEDGSIAAEAKSVYTTDMTFEDIITIMLEILIDEMNAELENPTYGDPITFEVEVAPDKNGYYIIDKEQTEEIGSVLLGS